MRGIARLRMLASMAVALGHAPKEVENLMNAPRVPDTPEKRTAETLEVEIPRVAAEDVQRTIIPAERAIHAIIKAKQPQLNRKARRRMAHAMQANMTKVRTGNKKRPRG